MGAQMVAVLRKPRRGRDGTTTTDVLAVDM